MPNDHSDHHPSPSTPETAGRNDGRYIRSGEREAMPTDPSLTCPTSNRAFDGIPAPPREKGPPEGRGPSPRFRRRKKIEGPKPRRRPLTGGPLWLDLAD